MDARAVLEGRRRAYHEWLATSPEWAQVTRYVRLRDGHRCRLCDQDGDLFIHHLSYVHGWLPPPEYLIAVCGKCHATLHSRFWYLDFEG